MKKPDKRENINLFFSAFLVIAFIVCAHFFTQFTQTFVSPVGTIVSMAIFVVFGLLLFYSTRVGDGKAVMRFSLVTLLVMVVPSLYIIIASVAPGLPLNSTFSSASGSLNVIVILACVALGYGIPYSFLSGFETDASADEAPAAVTAAPAEFEVDEILEGGVEADLLADSEDEAEEETEETEESNSEE